jgi:hypothetical protein
VQVQAPGGPARLLAGARRGAPARNWSSKHRVIAAVRPVAGRYALPLPVSAATRQVEGICRRRQLVRTSPLTRFVHGKTWRTNYSRLHFEGVLEPSRREAIERVMGTKLPRPSYEERGADD